MDRQRRDDLLRERADDYARAALTGIAREFPAMPQFVATGPGPSPAHRELHPAFYGCYDWHSAVEMHWALVRLLRRRPEATAAAAARAALAAHLTDANLAAEVAFFANPAHRAIERPYGWGWLLTLQHELEAWDDPDGRRWAAAVRPLADLLAANLAAWLPRLTYPQRTGVHPNTAFGLSLAHGFAARRAARGEPALLTAIASAARRFFAADADYPAAWEPSGADFLSPALTEAGLMSRVLPATEFPGWLTHFLPGLAEERPDSLFRPAVVSDSTDGQIAHLHGLNLSRAWAFAALADRLPAGDPRVGPLRAAAERHAAVSLPHVVGGDYATEHWLAAYAVLLLSDPEPAAPAG